MSLSPRLLVIKCDAISVDVSNMPLHFLVFAALASVLHRNKKQRHRQRSLDACAAHIFSSWTMTWLEGCPFNQSRSSWEQSIGSYQMLLMELTTAVSSAPTLSAILVIDPKMFSLSQPPVFHNMDAASSAVTNRKTIHLVAFVILKSIGEK